MRELVAAIRAHARAVHARRACATATAIDSARLLRDLERAGDLVRGELRPGGSEREWCDAGGAAPPAPRLACRPAQGDRTGRRVAPRPLPARLAGRRPPYAARRRRSTGCARCSSRCRDSPCPPTVWERDVLPAPGRRVLAVHGSTRSARAARSSGSAPARSVAPAGSRCTSARTCSAIGPPPRKGEPPERRGARRDPRAARAGRVLLHRPARRAWTVGPRSCTTALWDLVWAGEVTNDAFAPLRAPRLTLARQERGRPGRARAAGRFGRRRDRAARSRAAGR